MPQKLIDIKGCRFEKLTVIEYVGNEKWHCKCDCGNEIFATGTELRKGRRTNCGCSKKTNLNDLTGRKFGRLTAICRAESVKGNTRWNCECKCGNETTVSYQNLISGRTKSCGCWHDEALTINKKTHGMSKTKLYSVYRQMVERCYRKNNEAYRNYGGRGIRVCPEWLGKNGADNFFKWANESGYKENKGRNILTLDRKDVDGDYEPNNCRWVTAEVQNNNKRNSHFITIDGVTKTMAEWGNSNEYEADTNRICIRIKAGWSEYDAVTKPLQKKNKRKKAY